VILELTLEIPTASTTVAATVALPLLAEIVPTAASVPSTPAYTAATRKIGRATVRVKPPATATASSTTAISPAARGVTMGRTTRSSATAARPAGRTPLEPATGAVAAARGTAGTVVAPVHVAELGFCGEAGGEHESDRGGWASRRRG